jgi:hypothetical protein
MGAFFSTDNPIALFLALVVAVVLLRAYLGKHKWFQKDKAAYILPVLLVVIVLLVIYRWLLGIISFSIPLFVLLIIFLFAIGAGFFVLGMPRDKIFPMLKESGFVKTAVVITIICIIALSASRLLGPKLLEDKSVSFADAIGPEQENVQIDFAPLFSKQALGLIFIMTVMGLAFFFVNFAR